MRALWPEIAHERDVKAMLLAAGRGERLRPLTDATPKPLLTVGGKPLIVHHLERLARGGVREVVINVSWLAERIREALGDGARWGLTVRYSEEPAPPLETGGGILRALPLLGAGPFFVINADVYTDFELGMLPPAPRAHAHLLLVPNPPHHPQGDFVLDGERIVLEGAPRLTYAGIGVYRPELFAGCKAGRFPLLPLLRRAIAAGELSGQLYRGLWSDVGSAERLAALQRTIAAED